MYVCTRTIVGIAVGLGNHSALRPSRVVQAEGVEAEFLCEDLTGTIDWTLDGIYLRNIDSSGDGSIRREGRGSNTEALVVRALARYNNTDVRCVIYTREDGTISGVEYSEPGRLIVQGESLVLVVHTEPSTVRIMSHIGSLASQTFLFSCEGLARETAIILVTCRACLRRAAS